MSTATLMRNNKWLNQEITEVGDMNTEGIATWLHNAVDSIGDFLGGMWSVVKMVWEKIPTNYLYLAIFSVILFIIIFIILYRVFTAISYRLNTKWYKKWQSLTGVEVTPTYWDAGNIKDKDFAHLPLNKNVVNPSDTDMDAWVLLTLPRNGRRKRYPDSFIQVGELVVVTKNPYALLSTMKELKQHCDESGISLKVHEQPMSLSPWLTPRQLSDMMPDFRSENLRMRLNGEIQSPAQTEEGQQGYLDGYFESGQESVMFNKEMLEQMNKRKN